MSRIESTETFVIEAAMESVWAYFKELGNIGSCIPGCEEVMTLSPQKARLRVRIKLGYISKSLLVDVSIVESRQNEFLSFTGTSEDARIHGNLMFQRADTTTRITYTLSIEAASAMARTALTFMGKEFVRKQTQLFADCARGKITRQS